MLEPTRIEALERRMKADPASVAFAALAEEYRRAGRLDEAVNTCRAGLARHPNYVSARVTLGRALLDQGQLDEARHELEAVLRVAPENLAAVRGLADIHRRRGELAEALEQLGRALVLAPQDRICRRRSASWKAVAPPTPPREVAVTPAGELPVEPEVERSREAFRRPPALVVEPPPEVSRGSGAETAPGSRLMDRSGRRPRRRQRCPGRRVGVGAAGSSGSRQCPLDLRGPCAGGRGPRWPARAAAGAPRPDLTGAPDAAARGRPCSLRPTTGPSSTRRRGPRPPKSPRRRPSRARPSSAPPSRRWGLAPTTTTTRSAASSTPSSTSCRRSCGSALAAADPGTPRLVGRHARTGSVHSHVARSRDMLAARLDRLRQAIRETGLDALAVTHLPNIFYLSNFAGSAGMVVVAGRGFTCWPTSATVPRLPTDVRGRTPPGFALVDVPGSYDEALAALLADVLAGRRVGFEAAHVPVKQHAWLTARLGAAARAPRTWSPRRDWSSGCAW